jgi:small conductance mechanosensitive channel
MRRLRQKSQAKPILTSPLARQLRIQAIRRARRARWEAVILTPLLVGIVWAYYHREQLFGVDLPVRIASVIALVTLGWAFARALGGALGPMLMRHVEPGTAGTVGFVIRLMVLTASVLIALRVAGLSPQSLAVGGAFTAVIVGLAAQQTFGNLIAGMVLLSARPFRVGERVRFQAGALAGPIEGSVISLGLLYTTLAQGEDRIMVPNSVVLSAAVVPLREPASVDLRCRLRPDVKPSYVQEVLENAVTTPTRSAPHIGLEEVDADEVIMRIAATPESGSDGPKLADEILAVVSHIADGSGESNGNGNGASRASQESESDEDPSKVAHTPSGGWDSGNPD